jgi:hypothetical protein
MSFFPRIHGLMGKRDIPIVYSDWFLPSVDEALEMRDELAMYGDGLGGFDRTASYWTSSSTGEDGGQVVNMPVRSYTGVYKSSTYKVRPCRSFTSVVPYNLRDIGPSGGLIFAINGTTYYEAAPNDLADSTFSNIIDDIVIGGDGFAIGTGQANTTAIINQAGHINSAAKLCNDLSI